MDWQQVSALAIVAFAAVALLWSRFRRRPAGRSKLPCSGCGANAVPSRERLVLHARKGGRPELHVRAAPPSAGLPR